VHLGFVVADVVEVIAERALIGEYRRSVRDSALARIVPDPVSEIAFDAVDRVIVVLEFEPPLCQSALAFDFLHGKHLEGLSQALGEMKAIDDGVPQLNA